MELTFRAADLSDVDIVYEWANDPVTRANSYRAELISYKEHVSWFKKFITSQDGFMYIYTDADGNDVGLVRIQKTGDNEAVIGIGISQNHRGKRYSSKMLKVSLDDFFNINPECTVSAYIFKTNQASYKTFTSVGFKLIDEREVKGIKSYILTKENSA